MAKMWQVLVGPSSLYLYLHSLSSLFIASTKSSTQARVVVFKKGSSVPFLSSGQFRNWLYITFLVR